MIIARAMAMACFTVLKFMLLGIGGLLAVLTIVQLVRGDADPQMQTTLIGAAVSVGAALLCGWIAHRFELMKS